MTNKFDTYTLHARFFPGVLSATPLFVLWFFLARETAWKDMLDFIIGLKFLGTLSLSVAFLYFYSMFIRITSKYFESKYFKGENAFPTTYFMLYSDQTFSHDYKDKFRARAHKLLKLQPLNAVEEQGNKQEAQKRLDECINHIRLKVGCGKLVLKHNIWYGFSRNLIGGAIYSSVFCIGNILLGWRIFKSPPLIITSSILLVIYLTIFVFRKGILFQNAEAYARQLISEFMATGRTSSKD